MVAVVQRLRTLDLFKPPGVAETLDWVQALVALERSQLDAATFHSTLGAVLGYQDDIEKSPARPAARSKAKSKPPSAAGSSTPAISNVNAPVCGVLPLLTQGLRRSTWRSAFIVAVTTRLRRSSETIRWL